MIGCLLRTVPGAPGVGAGPVKHRCPEGQSLPVLGLQELESALLDALACINMVLMLKRSAVETFISNKRAVGFVNGFSRRVYPIRCGERCVCEFLTFHPTE